MANLINLNNTTPAAPANGQNVLWQSDASSPTNVSAYLALGSATTNVLINLAGVVYGDGNFTYNPSTGVITLNGATTAVLGVTNPTAATGGANQSSPLISLVGQYWNGAASATDTWTIENVLGSGTNPTSVLTFSHSGSGSGVSVNFPGSLFTGAIHSAGMTSSGTIDTPSANGADYAIGQASELLTLSLASAHTDTSASLLPANAIIDSVVIYITQTISGGSSPTTIAIGDATTSNRFISTGTPLTAGSSAVGLNQMQGVVSTNATGPVQTVAAKVRVTLDQIPGQGIVRITVFYRAFVAPSS